MLHRDGNFEEWQLADTARKYIPLYLKEKDDKVVYIPYFDDPSGLVKHVKFALLNEQWVYVDNSQNSI